MTWGILKANEREVDQIEDSQLAQQRGLPRGIPRCSLNECKFQKFLRGLGPHLLAQNSEQQQPRYRNDSAIKRVIVKYMMVILLPPPMTSLFARKHESEIKLSTTTTTTVYSAVTVHLKNKFSRHLSSGSHFTRSYTTLSPSNLYPVQPPSLLCRLQPTNRLNDNMSRTRTKFSH